jgi:uncharacterized oligopeptide transporter (OPT) family protein
MLLVFGAGLVVGTLAGVLILSLIVVSREADEEGRRLLEASE